MRAMRMDSRDLCMLGVALLVIGACLGCIAVLPGCALFEGACAKALPALTTTSVLIDDAQTKVDQAAAIVTRISDSAAREKALDVVAELRAALVSAESLAHAAASSCTAPDVSTVFAEFIAAWPKLLPFISLLGGPAGSQVKTPLVMEHTR